MAAIGRPATVAGSRRPFGVRLYLTLGFAAVASIAAGFSYLLVTGSSDRAASEQAADITIGRTVRLADRIGSHPRASAATQIGAVADQGYSAWAFNAKRRLVTSRVSRGMALGDVPGRAARSTEGRLAEPREGTGGRDEIADLGTALETMRIALRETFGALSSERDRLSAIFDALDDAVMVVGPQGEVRFSNRAAEPLIGPDGKAIDVLVPWLVRAAERGTAEHDGL